MTAHIEESITVQLKVKNTSQGDQTKYNQWQLNKSMTAKQRQNCSQYNYRNVGNRYT